MSALPALTSNSLILNCLTSDLHCPWSKWRYASVNEGRNVINFIYAYQPSHTDFTGFIDLNHLVAAKLCIDSLELVCYKVIDTAGTKGTLSWGGLMGLKGATSTGMELLISNSQLSDTHLHSPLDKSEKSDSSRG